MFDYDPVAKKLYYQSRISEYLYLMIFTDEGVRSANAQPTRLPMTSSMIP